MTKVRGQVQRLTPEQKAKRLAKRKRKKTWVARVWAKKHIKGKI